MDDSPKDPKKENYMKYIFCVISVGLVILSGCIKMMDTKEEAMATCETRGGRSMNVCSSYNNGTCNSYDDICNGATISLKEFCIRDGVYPSTYCQEYYGNQ